MRNTQVLVGMLSFSLSVGTWSVSGQETKPSDVPVAPKAETKVGEDSNLPAIPFQLIANIASNNVEAERLGLTKPQREELMVFVTAHFAERQRLHLVLSSFDQVGLKSFRLQLAVAELVEEATVNAQAKAQTLLTAEQRAKVRQANRQQIQQIQQMSFATRKPQLNSIGMKPLQQQLANGDLLSVLELPEIQQSLALTDEQWQRVEAAKKSAYPAARELVLQAREFATPMFQYPQINGASLQLMIEQFGQETQRLLSLTQRAKFQEMTEAQKKLLQVAIARREVINPNAFPQLGLASPHGSITSMQSQTKDGVSSTEIVLHNAFASREVVQKLELTDAQQQEIAKKLEEMHDTVLKKLVEEQEAGRQSDVTKRERLRELVLAHNAEYQQQLADLLTAEQQAQLKKECWKSLGWHALLQPEVAEQLRLTDEQKTEIGAALKTPGPQMTPFLPQPGNLDAFKKYSEDFHRKASEHQTAIAKRVGNSLSPEQREQFETVTGIKLPKIVPATE